MKCLDWLNKKIRKMEWYDISCVKIGVAAFALMIAKLWSPILGLEWYWYGLIFIVAVILPAAKMFGK